MQVILVVQIPKFANIFATTFNGNLTGNVTGTVSRRSTQQIS